eukprot:Skav208146  [mRNA]  locus=scaffold235:241234:243502:- [translate_table: standard]
MISIDPPWAAFRESELKDMTVGSSLSCLSARRSFYTQTPHNVASRSDAMGAMRFLIFTWTCIALAADATYQADSCNSALLQTDATVASLGTRSPGLIMWSYGRSATGSFMESFKKSSGMSYCNGKKDWLVFGASEEIDDGWVDNPVNLQIHEGFNRHRVLENRPLTSLALQNCMRWGERLLHMQPVQLEGKEARLRSAAEGQLKKDDLAKHDDSFYQRISLGLDRNVSLIQYYEESRRNYTLGVKAAQDGAERIKSLADRTAYAYAIIIHELMEVGFTIVPCNFADLVKDMCACVRPALATLTEKSSGCEERTIHDENADKEITLETFLSEENVAKIRASLKGTAYEWMLNLKATDWPKDVPPPIPVPTWRQHHSLN